jgi:hypothetical protein
VGEVRADELLVLVSDVAGLDVDSLAQTDVGLHLGQPPDIRQATSHVGLDGRTDVFELLAEAEENVEGIVGAARIFHVDADEVRVLASRRCQTADVLIAEVLVELEP